MVIYGRILKYHYIWPKSGKHISSVADVILIDCLTMFTTNHMMAHGSIQGQQDANRLEQTVLSELEALLNLIKSK